MSFTLKIKESLTLGFLALCCQSKALISDFSFSIRISGWRFLSPFKYFCNFLSISSPSMGSAHKKIISTFRLIFFTDWTIMHNEFSIVKSFVKGYSSGNLLLLMQPLFFSWGAPVPTHTIRHSIIIIMNSLIGTSFKSLRSGSYSSFQTDLP